MGWENDKGEWKPFVKIVDHPDQVAVYKYDILHEEWAAGVLLDVGDLMVISEWLHRVKQSMI